MRHPEHTDTHADRISRDFCKFWETSNISETVQNRDSSNRRLMGNPMWPIEWLCITSDLG